MEVLKSSLGNSLPLLLLTYSWDDFPVVKGSGLLVSAGQIDVDMLILLSGLNISDGKNEVDHVSVVVALWRLVHWENLLNLLNLILLLYLNSLNDLNDVLRLGVDYTKDLSVNNEGVANILRTFLKLLLQLLDSDYVLEFVGVLYGRYLVGSGGVVDLLVVLIALLSDLISSKTLS